MVKHRQPVVKAPTKLKRSVRGRDHTLIIPPIGMIYLCRALLALVLMSVNLDCLSSASTLI